MISVFIIPCYNYYEYCCYPQCQRHELDMAKYKTWSYKGNGNSLLVFCIMTPYDILKMVAEHASKMSVLISQHNTNTISIYLCFIPLTEHSGLKTGSVISLRTCGSSRRVFSTRRCPFGPLACTLYCQK